MDGEEREKFAESMINCFKDRIPIIIEKDPESSLAQIERKKYLAPHNMTIGSFIVTIRRKIKLENYQTLFISVKNTNFTPPSGMLMAEIYQKYRAPDKFLYLVYRSENAFG